MGVAVLRSKKGFSLIELLVSMVIILIVFLALAHALIVYSQNNILNALRNQSVKIAQSCLESLRVGYNCPAFDNVTYRNFTETFNISAPLQDNFSQGVNDAQISVSYSYKGKTYSYTLETKVYKK